MSANPTFEPGVDIRALNRKCEECAHFGHIAAAVELVDDQNLCAFHRDGDPCPDCKRLMREARCKVSLQQIVDAFSEFTKDGEVTVRYPALKEVNMRFTPRNARDRYAEHVDVALKSPTGSAEFPVPEGTSASTYRSGLSKELRRRGIGANYIIFIDRKARTIVVTRRPIVVESAK